METQLSQAQWLELPMPVRDRLRRTFGIQKSAPTQVTLGTYGKAQCDGSTDKDVSVLTVDAMQKYLGNYHLTDFFTLFTEVLTRMDAEEKTPPPEPEVKQVWDRWREDLQRMLEESEKIDLVLKLKHIVWEIFPQYAKPVQKTTHERTAKRK